jgi:cytochrome c oxidase subunit 2
MTFALTLFPQEASSYAGSVDHIFFALLGLSILLLIGLFGTMAVFLIRYREGSSAPRSREHVNSTPIEITWMAIPLLIFLVFFVWAARLYARMYTQPADGLGVYVVGKQWMWKIEHENGQREINQLHIPVGENILITLTSQDVVHSFYIPAFRIKHDAVPGSYSKFWFRAIKAGDYHIFCAQYCGMNHSQMIGDVVVMAPRDYAAWLAANPPEASMVQDGETLFHQVGCSGCHEATSTFHAPLLNGLYETQVPLQTGEMVTADRQYLRDSILLPNKQIVAGFAPIMPTYQGQLTEEQVNELVAYIISLKTKPYDNAARTTP